MRIVAIEHKVANTRRGPAPKWLVTLDDSRIFDTFIGDWNKHWAPGMEVEIEDGQFESRIWQGKEYLSVKAPSNHYSPRPNPVAQTHQDNQEVIDALRKVYEKIEESTHSVMGALQLISQEIDSLKEINKKVDTDEIRIDDVPF